MPGHEIRVISNHHRRAACGQLETHRAACRQRQIRRGKGRAFVGRLFDDDRRMRPARGHLAHHRCHAPHGGQNDAQPRLAIAQAHQGLVEAGAEALDLARARAGQAQHQRLIFTDHMGLAKCGGLLDCGPRLGHDRMTDEIATHAGGGHIGRLEGQKRQNVVNHLGHLRRPPRAPGPDRGRDIVDRAQIGPRRPGGTRHPQTEIRAVDGDQRVGGKVHDPRRRLGDAPLQVAVFRQDLHDAHDRKLFHREAALQPLGRHQRAADPVKLDRGDEASEPRHQRRAELVARGLARDQEKLHRSRAHRNKPA